MTRVCCVAKKRVGEEEVKTAAGALARTAEISGLDRLRTHQ